MPTKERTEEHTFESETSSSSKVEEYYQKTGTSREWFKEATEFMPGGNTRGVMYHSPYPSYVDKAQGCRLIDVDGNEFIDFLNNYTSLIHGHAPEQVMQSGIEALKKEGPAPGAPTRAEIDWAEHLCHRADAVEHIRFSNSGTEGTMNAIRAARAYTGNDVIAKFEGHYHGTHDDVQISVHPPEHLAGTESDPNSVPDSAGVPSSKEEEVLTLPFNDAEGTIEKLERNRSKLAGVIIAPLTGSWVIPAKPSFITRLDEYTTEHDIPLIFDEVISFRVGYGGAHTRYDVEPDLVTYGKIIGGGFAVGAFGGRTELMEGFDPRGGSRITHSGTFNANPVTATAGLTALEAYDEAEVERINDLGKTLAEMIRSAGDNHGISLQVNQFGSLFKVYLANDPVENYRDSLQSASDLEKELYFELLSEGIRLAPKLMGALSTPMTEDEINECADAFDTALERLRPQIEARAPHLVEN